VKLEGCCRRAPRRSGKKQTICGKKVPKEHTDRDEFLREKNDGQGSSLALHVLIGMGLAANDTALASAVPDSCTARQGMCDKAHGRMGGRGVVVSKDRRAR